MKISVGQMPQVMQYCYDAGFIPHFEGPPGMGKSEVTAQFVASLREKLGNPKNFFFEELRGSTLEPTDLTGLPFLVNGKTTWAPPKNIPEDPGTVGVWFWDEFGQSSQAVMCALTPFMDRTGPAANFPKGVMIVLASNRTSDGAAVNRIPSHIRNRVLHFELGFSVDDWSMYNMAVGTRPEVIAFGRFKPELFCENPPKDGKPFMTGRSLTKCSKVLELGVKAPLDLAMYSALLGEGAAIELTGFMRVMQSLIPPDMVLLDPDKAPIPAEESAQFAMCQALIFKATPGNFDKICQYAMRLPAEKSILLVVGSIQRHNAVMLANKAAKLQPLVAAGGKYFTEWSIKYQDCMK